MRQRDEGMEPLGLERALALVADEAEERDVAEAAWRQGRAARRRGQVVAGALTAGAVAAAALTWSMIPRDGGSLAPAGESADRTASVAEEPSRYREIAAGVRSKIEGACLDEAGWSVSRERNGVWKSATWPTHAGAGEPRELRADLAACEEVTGMGVTIGTSVETDGLSGEDEATIRAVYREYAAVAKCLQDELSLVVWVPDEESFVNAYPVGSTPPWHPYSTASSYVGPVEIAQSCPIVDTWSGAKP
ncbi:hypothetical protein [Ornithinimicrobium panacihumi]|uniref:hypothetical protein n=1 Tax=Ornithinimicrobium panacihumi TaxID=2008449 RepID=UPI003F8BDCDC